jgi:hypothetical protein
MRKYILIALIGISANSFAQSTSLLDSAYNNNSLEVLNIFLTKWQIETSDTIELENDTIKMVYEVFNAFYYPNKLSKYSGNGAYFTDRNHKYLLVQAELKYSICSENSLLQDTLKAFKLEIENQLFTQLVNQKVLSIPDFKPQLKFDSTIVLFLTPSYKETIQSFLGPVKVNDTSDDSAFAKTSWLKQTCDITIRNNKWCAFHDDERIILSSPQIEYLFIDPILETASIYFTIEDLEIGVAYFEKKEGIWNRTRLIIACTDCD